VDDDGGATIAEDGVVVRAEGNVGSDGAGVSSAVRANDQGKVGNVAGGMDTVSMPGSIEVRTRGFEVGRFAKGVLVNVDGVCAGRKIFDVESDFDAGGRGGQEGGADALPLGINEIDGNGLGGGMGMGVLRKDR